MNTISQIALITENGYIAKKDASLPVKCSHDAKRFARITRRKAVIMGRKTFETFSKPLADRLNIVLTRNRNFNAPGILIAESVDDALEQAYAFQSMSDEVMIIGGGDVYSQTINICERLYLSVIIGDYPGMDTRIKYPITYKQILNGELKEWVQTRKTEKGNITYITLQRRPILKTSPKKKGIRDALAAFMRRKIAMKPYLPAVTSALDPK